MSVEDNSYGVEIIIVGNEAGDGKQPYQMIDRPDGQLSYSQLSWIATHQQSEEEPQTTPHGKRPGRPHTSRTAILYSMQPTLWSAGSDRVSTNPRLLHERLQMSGVQTLSNGELITLVLSTSPGRGNIQERIQRLLESHNLQELINTDFGELCQKYSLSKEKAGQLQALLEVARRLTLPQVDERYQIISPMDAANLLIPYMASLDHEEVRTLLLDTKNRVVANILMYVGTLNSSVLRTSEIFQPAIARKCAGVIVCHNHPSGSTEPSPEDIAITQECAKAGNILGIELVDHIIIGGRSFLSLKERLAWK